jgi:hypothetical protein
MGLESIATADAAFLLEELGIEVTHRPRGVEADDRQVLAIVEWEKPQRDMQAGAENVRTGTITVLSMVPVTKESHWVIRGEVCITHAMGSIEAGLRTAEIKIRDAGQRSAKGRTTY